MRTFACALLALAISACSDRGIIVDDWGPPAGYSAIGGTVRSAAGVPVAGAEVTFTRCGTPVGGLLGAVTTSAAGTYLLEAALPPVRLTSPVESLTVSCQVFVDRQPTGDSLLVRFRTEKGGAPLQVYDVAPR